jgi:uncharacterized protein (TIGR03083 family)
LVSLLAERDTPLDLIVPVTPAWRVRDVVAHLIGVAEDLLAQNFPDFSDPKGRPEQAAARERWTEAQVQRRRGRTVGALVEEWESLGPQIETALAAAPEDSRYPLMSRVAATFDLGCHLHDVRHAVGRPGDRDAAVTRVAFRMARTWLDLRLQRGGRGRLDLVAPGRSWTVGTGDPAASVAGSEFELFRSISGRRNLEQILDLDWTGDPQPFLDVLSPYPLPLVEITE